MIGWIARQATSFAVAAGCTLAVFLVLPLMQSVRDANPRELMVRGVDLGNLPPPPPPLPEVEEPEPEPEPEPPPELMEEAPALDLTQLELALNPGFGDGMGGDFTIKLFDQIGEGGDGGALDEIFSLGDLDRQPRIVYQRLPTYPTELRKSRLEGTVHILFEVSTDGRVVNPRVEKSSHQAFERSALEALKKWRFEPGRRDGRAVAFKMRLPISFSYGS